MKKQPKRRITKKPKTEPNVLLAPLNPALIALIAIGRWVLVEGALDTEESRADLKTMFRQGLIAVPQVQETAEWQYAMAYTDGINATLGVQ